MISRSTMPRLVEARYPGAALPAAPDSQTAAVRQPLCSRSSAQAAGGCDPRGDLIYPAQAGHMRTVRSEQPKGGYPTVSIAGSHSESNKLFQRCESRETAAPSRGGSPRHFETTGGSDQTLREQDSHLHRAGTALAGPDAAAGDPRHRQPRTGLEQPGSRKGNNRGTLLGSEGQSDNRHGSGRPTPLPSVPWRHQLPESRRTRLLAALVDLETLCEVVMAAGALLAVGWFVTHDLGTVWRWCGGLVR